jgi:hypothetical protein
MRGSRAKGAAIRPDKRSAWARHGAWTRPHDAIQDTQTPTTAQRNGGNRRECNERVAERTRTCHAPARPPREPRGSPRTRQPGESSRQQYRQESENQNTTSPNAPSQENNPAAETRMSSQLRLPRRLQCDRPAGQTILLQAMPRAGANAHPPTVGGTKPSSTASAPRTHGARKTGHRPRQQGALHHGSPQLVRPATDSNSI